MSKYLSRKYLPVADTLLATHGLSVPHSTREMLAKCIMHSRELKRSDEPSSDSPLPAANKAVKHARKLIQYAESPPRRHSSVPNRCIKLRAALLESAILPICLGLYLANKGAAFDFGELLDSLDAGHIDKEALAALVDALDVIAMEPKGWRDAGRPWGLSKPIVRAGCMAWIVAGNHRLTYRWDESAEELIGELPNFLRDLLACCAGTHALVRELEHSRKPVQHPRGDGLFLSDSSLKLAVIACGQDSNLREYLHKKVEHI